MNTKRYFNTCKNLVWADLTVFKQNLVDKIIDIGIWVILTIVVTGYVMPFFGLSNFGPFQFGGVLAAIGLFELYSSVVDVVVDLEGDRVINYNLTLPIPSVLALLSKSIYYFTVYVVLTVAMLPIGWGCLMSQWHTMDISYFKLALVIIFQSMFYACFVLWAASMVPNMGQFGKIWSRFIFPMWFMGGFQFSWLALYHAIPTLAYINVINPMIYITESMRAALLGQTGYANFWLCLLAITFFSMMSLALGIRNLKKRLDFV
jgi:ABC-type polysaccharide/polyol phosphate export permease